MNRPMPHLPALRRDGNLAIYLSDIRKFPILDADEEYMLAKSWKEHGDLEAAHKLVTSHLRLVAKIAVGYRGYGLPLADLIAEGNIGMMQAVKRFDPDRGFRLSTYAMWWIRAAIQEYILHSWSLVKIGTTAAQKKLFFNLRRLKGEMKAINDGDLSSEQVEEIAERLSVPKEDVITMNRRMIGSDQSLNARVSKDGESTEEWQDWLVEPSSGADEQLGEEQELTLRQRLLSEAMEGLTARERMIIVERRLSEKPSTLEELSQKLGISRERVRQIELRGFEKLQYAIKRAAEEESAADF